MKKQILLATVTCLLALNCRANAAEVGINFPLNRIALQTNESVPVAVVRSDNAALAADTLAATVVGEDGSRMQFTFPVAFVALQEGTARATEHLNLNARFLRPGRYTLPIAVNGANASTPFEVYSHLRRSTYKLIN